MFNLATNPPPGPLIWRWQRETSSWSAAVGPLRVVVARKLPAVGSDQLLMTVHGPGSFRRAETGPVSTIYAALADPDVGESLLMDASARAKEARELCLLAWMQLRGSNG
jgi:hypothetical protein